MSQENEWTESKVIEIHSGIEKSEYKYFTHLN